MGKLVAKTALCTVSVLIGLALIVFGAVSLAAPSAMLAFSDDLGMDKLSAAYSVAVCERTEKIEDLAEAVERNYNVSNYKECAEYGLKLFADPDFERYCAARDQQTAGYDKIRSGYRQYATGIVSASLYRTGSSDAAFDTAFSVLNNDFPANNAVIYLAYEAISAQDVSFCGRMIEELEKISPQDTEEAADKEALNALLREVAH